MKNPIKIKHNGVKLIAHRGLSGIERENSAAAFIAAGNRSYFGIETDVHTTFDNQFIIIHDDKTGRVADQNISVEKSTYEELRQLRMSDLDGYIRGDLCLPSLEEYLRICKKYNKTAVLELKNLISEHDLESILCIVKNEISLDQIIFISFVFENLTFIRKTEKKATLQFLCSCKIDNELINKIKQFNIDIDIYYAYLNQEKIQQLHQNNIKVNCWTVDNKKDAESLISYGVDYITTNILA